MSVFRVKDPDAVTWLHAELVVRLHREALYDGEARGLNPGSDLEGALNRPRTHLAYGGASDYAELAALYGVAVAKAHAFLDGNKRTALLATGAFLVLNGFSLDYPVHDDRAAALFEQVAEGSAGVEELAEWIRHCAVPVR
jgi:death-on-curing protein